MLGLKPFKPVEKHVVLFHRQQTECTHFRNTPSQGKVKCHLKKACHQMAKKNGI